ncbi:MULTISPECIES: transposase family protein [Bacillaceae]|uniref:transposase family protein n=1 Tax=Bacillaceae TaxID=186817 RepID=UPI00118B66BA|nr:transposase family protein [Bacillus sp. S3]QCJ44660.1 transposase [Bacillus sp. S3]
MVISNFNELFKFDQNVEVLYTIMEPDAMYAVLKICSKHAQCPECKHVSSRQHSQYARKVDDLPVSGHSVHITVLLHKWFCGNKDCKVKVFTERLNWLSPSARKTNRLENLIRHVGFTNNCLAAEKICRKMRISISHDAILYRIKKEEPVQPRECPFRGH